MWKDVPSKLSELVLGDASGMGCRVIVQEHGALTVSAFVAEQLEGGQVGHSRPLL